MPHIPKPPPVYRDTDRDFPAVPQSVVDRWKQDHPEADDVSIRSAIVRNAAGVDGARITCPCCGMPDAVSVERVREFCAAYHDTLLPPPPSCPEDITTNPDIEE